MPCLSIQIFLRSRITYKKGWWPKKQIWRTHLLGAAMALTCASAARSVLEPEVAHQQEGCHQSAKMFPASGSSLIEDAPHVHVQEIATSGLHLETALAAGWRYERVPKPHDLCSILSSLSPSLSRTSRDVGFVFRGIHVSEVHWRELSRKILKRIPCAP